MEISNQNISLSSRHFFFHTQILHQTCPYHRASKSRHPYIHIIMQDAHILMSRKDTKMNPKIYIFRTTPPGHRSPADDRPNIEQVFPQYIESKQASTWRTFSIRMVNSSIYALSACLSVSICVLSALPHAQGRDRVC